MKLKKDFNWLLNGVHYVVRNVPYELLEVEGEEFLDLGVAIKLEMIRDLMYQKTIPNDVNFEVVSDLKF